MTDLEKIQELTKALQEGKTLVNVSDKNFYVKMINSTPCCFHGDHCSSVGCSFDPSYWKIQEPEPPKEETP